MERYRFSIFTATYNHAHLLKNVYNCLLAQTFKDFEWVVVGDDGCTDNTEEVVNELISRNEMKIKFAKRPHGGKHIAWKVGTDLFEGRYVFGADDDDFYPPNALEVLDKYWKELEAESNYDAYWEIRGRVVKEDGALNGKAFETPVFDSDYNEINYKLGYGTLEMQGCRKASVLRNEAAVPNNIIYGENLTNFSDGIRWSRAARKYKTRFVSDVLRKFNDTPGSLGKSGGGNKNKMYNTLVAAIYTLNEQRDLMLKYRKKDIFYNSLVIAYEDLRLKEHSLRYIENQTDKILYCLFKPLAWITLLFRR